MDAAQAAREMEAMGFRQLNDGTFERIDHRGNCICVMSVNVHTQWVARVSSHRGWPVRWESPKFDSPVAAVVYADIEDWGGRRPNSATQIEFKEPYDG